MPKIKLQGLSDMSFNSANLFRNVNLYAKLPIVQKFIEKNNLSDLTYEKTQ